MKEKCCNNCGNRLTGYCVWYWIDYIVREDLKNWNWNKDFCSRYSETWSGEERPDGTQLPTLYR